MPVHIFQVDETNFEICRKYGLAGIFDAERGNINDTLISRLSLMRIGDPVLFYVGRSSIKKEKSKKELYGVWKVSSEPFYDTCPVWTDQVYPYRICVEELDGAVLKTPIRLSDIYHLIDTGRIWTFALMRNHTSVNAVFSMTAQEYDVIYDEFIKVNQDGPTVQYLTEPYRNSDSPLMKRLHYEKGLLKFESSLMALLADGLKTHTYSDVLHHYSDYSMYVPTNWGKEIDMLLIHGHPKKTDTISSYDIIEVKKQQFDEAGLEQLLDYESWFIQNRVRGDAQMVRSIAIAQSFHPNVIKYLQMRSKYEKKNISLLNYTGAPDGKIQLAPYDI